MTHHRSKGFTLVEMAMVLLIMGLLLAGGLTVLSTQIEQQRIGDTQRQLEQAREALMGFALANGRFPCPASAVVVSGAATAGLEPTPVVAAGCANLAGVLPWATLGLPETDPWGRRFTYRITRQFTRTVPQAAGFVGGGCPPPVPPTQAAFALCSQGDMTIVSTGGGATLSANAPVVLVSHGKNGAGAYMPTGTQSPVGADADELDNQLTAGGTNTANTQFVSKSPTATFDDLVVWLPTPILMNRMVQAGRLP